MDLLVIGSRLVFLHKEKEISQVKLSELTEFDRTYLSRVEHGKQNVTITTLCFICDCLGITLKEFFYF